MKPFADPGYSGSGQGAPVGARHRFWHHVRQTAALATAALVLSGCFDSIADGLRPQERFEALEQTEEFRLSPPSRSFVHAPEALIMMERSLGSSIEQHISLPNDTVIRGDNVLYLRARAGRETNIGLLQLQEFLTRMGGPPDPFERITESDLVNATDELGTYFFAERRVGTETVCVVAIRRLQHGARTLPRGADALDVLLRNCVRGSRADALEPIGARRLAVGAGAGIDGGALQTLSPHAAPQGFTSRPMR